MSPLAGFGLLLRMALRSLWSHKVKSLIVGSLMAFGTTLVVTGTALLDSIQSAMSRSVIHSLAGHLQVYSSDAQDELSIYGGGVMGGNDVGEISDFSKVKRVIAAVPNVKAVVPMGIQLANMSRGSDLDRAFTSLRGAHRTGDATVAPRLIPRIKRLLGLLESELENREAVSSPEVKKTVSAQLADVRRVIDPAFWTGYDADPLAALDFLDTRIAPLGGEGRLMYLRYVGTDLESFSSNFDRFQLVEGEMVPKGVRGLLINQRFAESRLKLTAARLLDDLEEGREQGVPISGTPNLESKARRLSTLAGSITILLEPEDAKALEGELARHIAPVGPPTDEGKKQVFEDRKAGTQFTVIRKTAPDPKAYDANLDRLLTAFLTMDDATVAWRYRFFYDVLAKKVALYPFETGEVVTIRSFTKGGYIKAVNVKVWGKFVFKGLERSELSGAANLLDLMTFRDLYGQMTAAQREELVQIQAEAGAQKVARENAEDLFFGGGDDTEEAETETTGFSEFAGLDLKRQRRATVDERRFNEDELEGGMALNAAILREDDSMLAVTQAAVQKAVDEAGLKLRVIDHEQASGLIGQLAMLIRGILYVAIFIIFAVALVIINNSMVMATLERVREIGTLRAIGAQKRFVMAMFMLETLTLGLLTGGLGAAMGAGIITLINRVGIPATNDVMVFAFSGPRLRPDFTADHIFVAVGIIMVVTLLATYYPARIATRIQPIEAMRGAATLAQSGVIGVDTFGSLVGLRARVSRRRLRGLDARRGAAPRAGAACPGP